MKQILSLFILILILYMNSFSQQDSSFALVIHGGAGTILQKNMSDDKEQQYIAELSTALNKGHLILKNGGTSLDAVVEVVKILENSPLFNAGKGSVFTNEGTIEMDASIMDGKNLRAGAVAAVKTVKNPIEAARLVMDKSPHVMLTGKGADEFAKSNGLKTEEQDYFKDSVRYRQWQKILQDELLYDNRKGSLFPPVNSVAGTDQKYGTVGAVALDKHGNLAAATSTGGMTNKRYGRVGDSPIIGAGTYANNNTCAVSCTGHGEYFIRLSVAHDISSLMEYKGLSVKEAADELVFKKLPALGGTGGVIAIDKNANIAMPFNTEGMYRGYITKDGKAVVKIFKE